MKTLFLKKSVGILFVICCFISFPLFAITDAEITTILQEGIPENATADDNSVYFSVVSNKKILKEIQDDMKKQLKEFNKQKDNNHFSMNENDTKNKKNDKNNRKNQKRDSSDMPLSPPQNMGFTQPMNLGNIDITKAEYVIFVCSSQERGNNDFFKGMICQKMTLAAEKLGQKVKAENSLSMLLNSNIEEYCKKLSIPNDMKIDYLLLLNYDDSKTTNENKKIDITKITSFVK